MQASSTMNVSCNGYLHDNNRPIRPLYVGTAARAHLPDSVHLWTPPVLDQGQSMACTGMAGAVMVDVAAHNMGKDFRASPRGLWTLARMPGSVFLFHVLVDFAGSSDSIVCAYL
jgi:hypothetical protein